MVFKSCTWEENECDHEYIKKEYTDMGLCYTFNWNPSDVLHSTNTGKQQTSCFAECSEHSCCKIYLYSSSLVKFVAVILLVLLQAATANCDFVVGVDKDVNLPIIAGHFYRTMHFSAKRGIAIACRLSVCPSVRPSVCNVGDLGPHRSEISESNCTNT